MPHLLDPERLQARRGVLTVSLRERYAAWLHGELNVPVLRLPTSILGLPEEIIPLPPPTCSRCTGGTHSRCSGLRRENTRMLLCQCTCRAEDVTEHEGNAR